ncbi:MAG: glycine cleavage system protein GcvH [Isosphaeraceae bacterium]
MDQASLRFAPTHEWIHVDGDIATIGISKFAADQLSDLIMLELPRVGSRVAPGKSFGVIESVKSVSDLYAPVSGEVVEANTSVADNLELLSSDPYGKGWLIKVKLEGPAPKDLLDLAAYEKQIAEEGH